MSEHIDISEGTTGSNGVPAAIFGAAGVGLLTVSFVYSVLCFIICALFAGMKEGIEFRSKNKTYRKYFDCFGFRIGKWRELPVVRSAELVMRIRKTAVKRWLPASARYQDHLPVKEKLLTFDILLNTETKEQRLYEFNKYKSARKALLALEEILQIPVQDHFLDQLNESE